MMQQAAKIRDAVKPDETLFVIDSMLGQDAVNVAKAFEDGVGITAVDHGFVCRLTFELGDQYRSRLDEN
jgi:hypothetical protein